MKRENVAALNSMRMVLYLLWKENPAERRELEADADAMYEAYLEEASGECFYSDLRVVSVMKWQVC